MFEYYRLTKDFGSYPKGLVVYVVETRTWMQYNEVGDFTRHSDGKLIGSPNINNPRNPECSWCIERQALKLYPTHFEKVVK